MPGERPKRTTAKPKQPRQRTYKLEERQQYYDARSSGLGKMASAAVAGVTPATAKIWEDQWKAAGNDDFELQKIKGPRTKQSEMGHDARRALDDFNYFQERYLGRVALPWQKATASELARLSYSPEREYVVVNLCPGSGKALALDTPLKTPTGWTTMGEVQVGDYVIDDQGKPTKVLAKSEVFEAHDCYEVKTDDGASVIADANHLWNVRMEGAGTYGYVPVKPYPDKTGPKPKGGTDGISTRTTEYLAKKRHKRPQLQITAPIQAEQADLPIDPYVLGAWLGDGHSAGARMTAHDDDAKWIRQYFEEAGYATTEQSGKQAFGVLGLQKKLRLAGLLNNKHVPEQYFHASPEQRLALLQGLIDTDGHVSPTGHIEFCSTKRNLAEAAQLLAHSLGVKASLNTGRASLNGKDCGEKYRVMFYLKDAARLPRKAMLTRDGVRTATRYLTVDKVDTVPTQCIQVDSPSHLFLAGKGLMVTHNSTLITHDFLCWMIAKNRGIRVCILSSTQNNAEKFADRIRRTLEATVPIQAPEKELRTGISKDAKTTLTKDFGRFKPEEATTWTKKKFFVDRPAADETHKDATVEAFGKDQAFLGGRFDVVICDDVYDPKSVRTLESKNELKAWFSDVAESRLEPAGLMIVNMQRVDSEDLSRYCLDMEAYDDSEDEIEDEELTSLKAEKEKLGIDPLPIRDGKVRKYRHFAYKAHFDGEDCKGPEFHKLSSPAYPVGCLLYPRRLSYRELRTKEKNDPGKFLVWYQQEDFEPGNVLVDPIWVKGGTDDFGIQRPGCWDHKRGAREAPSLQGTAFSFVSVDPSPSQFWAIQHWLYHPDTKQLYLIDTVRQRMTSAEFFDHDPMAGLDNGVLTEFAQYARQIGIPITHAVVEVNAAQKFMYESSSITQWLRINGINLIPHSTGAVNKNNTEYGVQGLQPWFRDGRIRLPGKDPCELNSRIRSMKLVDEVQKYRLDGTSAYTDDQVMAAWFATIAVDKLYREKKAIPKQWRPSFVRQPSYGVA